MHCGRLDRRHERIDAVRSTETRMNELTSISWAANPLCMRREAVVAKPAALKQRNAIAGREGPTVPAPFC